MFTRNGEREFIKQKKMGINLATFTPLMHLFKPKSGEIISSGEDFEIFVHTDTQTQTMTQILAKLPTFTSCINETHVHDACKSKNIVVW